MHRLWALLLVVVLVGGFEAAIADEQPAIADISWTLGPNLPEFRKGGCATVMDGQLISVFGMRQPWGEMSTMYIYDPQANDWSRGPDAPIGQTYVQGTEAGGAFFAIGGRSRPLGGVHTQCYQLRRQEADYVWNRLPDLNQKRGWAPSVALDGKLYVFGGALGGHGPTLGSVEALNLAAPSAGWQSIGEIPGDSRGWLGAAAVDGAIYVMGGSHFLEPKPKNGPDRRRLNEVWRFDPQTAKWTPRAPLPFRLSGFDSCVYADRYIIVVGGAPDAADFTEQMRREQAKDRFHASYYCPFVLVYDTQTDAWKVLPTRLPVPTNDIRVVLNGETLYAIGGENIEPATSNTTPWLRIGRIEK